MTAYSFGDIVLVPFPFTDQTGSKKRPAVVVSSASYHRERADLILMAVTSQVRKSLGIGEMPILEWKAAGLLKNSNLKPILFTAKRPLIERKLGQLGEGDRASLRRSLSMILEISAG
jgi:mRNA interferase MazF